MRAFLRLVGALVTERKGPTAAEYGLILALIVIRLMLGVRALGGTNRQVRENISVNLRLTRSANWQSKVLGVSLLPAFISTLAVPGPRAGRVNEALDQHGDRYAEDSHLPEEFQGRDRH